MIEFVQSCMPEGLRHLPVMQKARLADLLRSYQSEDRFYHDLKRLIRLLGLTDYKACPSLFPLFLLLHALHFRSDTEAEWPLEGLNLSQQQEMLEALAEWQNPKVETALVKYLRAIEIPHLMSSFSNLLGWEEGIFKERQALVYSEYCDQRLSWLAEVLPPHPRRDDLIDWIHARRPRIGIYPGTFNPFHIGHLNILRKSELFFDKVIVALGHNPQKGEDSTIDLRIQGLKKFLVFREVLSYEGYISDFVENKGPDWTIIRGLRNGYDLEYELNQLRFIEDMAKFEVRMCFIPCDREFSYVSSTAIRNMEKLPGHKERAYLPRTDWQFEAKPNTIDLMTDGKIVLGNVLGRREDNPVSSAVRERIDRYLKEKGLNDYGDAPGTVYLGGTPLMDEKTGKVQDRYAYILKRHPHLG